MLQLQQVVGQPAALFIILDPSHMTHSDANDWCFVHTLAADSTIGIEQHVGATRAGLLPVHLLLQSLHRCY